MQQLAQITPYLDDLKIQLSCYANFTSLWLERSHYKLGVIFEEDPHGPLDEYSHQLTVDLESFLIEKATFSDALLAFREHEIMMEKKIPKRLTTKVTKKDYDIVFCSANIPNSRNVQGYGIMEHESYEVYTIVPNQLPSSLRNYMKYVEAAEKLDQCLEDYQKKEFSRGEFHDPYRISGITQQIPISQSHLIAFKKLAEFMMRNSK